MLLVVHFLSPWFRHYHLAQSPRLCIPIDYGDAVVSNVAKLTQPLIILLSVFATAHAKYSTGAVSSGLTTLSEPPPSPIQMDRFGNVVNLPPRVKGLVKPLSLFVGWNQWDILGVLLGLYRIWRWGSSFLQMVLRYKRRQGCIPEVHMPSIW